MYSSSVTTTHKRQVDTTPKLLLLSLWYDNIRAERNTRTVKTNKQVEMLLKRKLEIKYIVALGKLH